MNAQIGLSDISAWLTSILVVDGGNLKEIIYYAITCVGNCRNQIRERQVRNNSAVVCRPAIVLYLLDEDNVRGFEGGGDMCCDSTHVR